MEDWTFPHGSRKQQTNVCTDSHNETILVVRSCSVFTAPPGAHICWKCAYVFTPPVGYSGSLSTVNETCNKDKGYCTKKILSVHILQVLPHNKIGCTPVRLAWEDHLSSLFHSEEFDEQASITSLPVLTWLLLSSTSSEVLSDFQIWCSPGCQMHLDKVTMKTCSQSLSASPRTMSSKLWYRKGVLQHSTYLQNQMNLSPQVSRCLSWILNFCSLTLLRRHCLIGWLSQQRLFWSSRREHKSPRAYLSTCLLDTVTG